MWALKNERQKSFAVFANDPVITQSRGYLRQVAVLLRAAHDKAAWNQSQSDSTWNDAKLKSMR